MMTQTMVLHACVLAGSRSPIVMLLLNKLANYVAQGGTDRYAWSSGGSSDVHRAVALAGFDKAVGSNNPEINFQATSGAAPLMVAKFTSSNLGPMDSSTKWEALANPPAPMVLVAQGKGQLNVAAGLRFEAADMPDQPVYRGFFVEQVIRALDGSGHATGPPLKGVPLGSMVSVTLQVTTPDDIDTAVQIEAWVPGGLEPMDPNVDSSALSSDGGRCGGMFNRRSRRGSPPGEYYGGGEYGGGYRREPVYSPRYYGWWWYCPSFQRETMTDRVTWYADRGMRAGTQDFEFQAMAATVGKFALPPAQAQVVLQPEVMGLSAGGSFQVARGALTKAQSQLPAPQPPKLCPGDGCSGNGACDIVTGTCKCGSAFTGADCKAPAAPLVIELMPQPRAAAATVEVISLGAKFNPEAADFVFAMSSNEDAVISGEVVYDAEAKTIAWSPAADAVKGSNARVTVVATQGNNVVYRQFEAVVGQASTVVAYVPYVPPVPPTEQPKSTAMPSSGITVFGNVCLVAVAMAVTAVVW